MAMAFSVVTVSVALLTAAKQQQMQETSMWDCNSWLGRLQSMGWVTELSVRALNLSGVLWLQRRKKQIQKQ